MAFSNGQLVQAADLNNFSVTTVTTSGAIVAGTTLSVTGATTLSSTAAVTGTLSPLGLVDISGASAGQIKFPGTQNASSNANTLDDYEEFTWTPGITFATPGDLSVAYTTQTGLGIKIGSMVTLWGYILTSTFTHATASGSLQITGNSLVASSTNVEATGPLAWQGITKANYTNATVLLQGSSATFGVLISGSGQATAFVGTGDMPTGGTVALRFSLSFRV